ncbi:MAG: putrescine aminotransferase [Planctomycetota bacterium]|jgi:putrescine aminotransferase
MSKEERQTSEWQAADARNYLHPFTHHKELHEKKAAIIVRGEGCYVWDSDGNKFLDGLAGLACVNIGYGRKELGEAAANQINTLNYFNSFFKASNKPAILLAEKLVELTPAGLNHVFYANSGSEANDTALRIARNFWILEGKPEKHVIIAREMAYHGSTVAAGALSGMPPMHEQAAVLDGIEHIQCPYQFAYGRGMSEEEFGLLSASWLEDKINEIGADKVAAFFAEPIQGAGGGKIPPANYFIEIQKICKKHDVLLVIDEVICGFGRTGHWFASEHFGIENIDLMCLAKGVTSAYIPLSACMVNDRVADTLINKGGEFFHGFTYSGHPVSCAVALENIRILEDEKLVEKVAMETGPYLAEKLLSIADHAVVGEVRSCGLLAAVELVRDRNTLEPLSEDMDEVEQICEVFRDYCLKHGIISRPVFSTIILTPPLIITKDEIDFLIDKFRLALDDLANYMKK